MSVGSGDAQVRQPSGRRRTVGWWALGLVLVLVLGGAVVRAVVRREPSPMASRPLLIRTLDRPLIMLGSEPPNRFDPPRPAERAGVPAATVFQAWLRATRGSVYDRAVRSSRPIPVTLVRWSSGPEVAPPGRLTWLFQFTGVPCGEPGFVPPGGSPPPLDRAGCDEYAMFDAHSGAGVGGFGTRAGAAVLRAP